MVLVFVIFMWERQKELKANEKRKRIIFTNDIVVDSEKEINKMFYVLSNTLKLWKLQVNEQKTKTMIVRKDLKEITTKVQINGTTMKESANLRSPKTTISGVNKEKDIF